MRPPATTIAYANSSSEHLRRSNGRRCVGGKGSADFRLWHAWRLNTARRECPDPIHTMTPTTMTTATADQVVHPAPSGTRLRTAADERCRRTRRWQKDYGAAGRVSQRVLADLGTRQNPETMVEAERRHLRDTPSKARGVSGTTICPPIVAETLLDSRGFEWLFCAPCNNAGGHKTEARSGEALPFASG